MVKSLDVLSYNMFITRRLAKRTLYLINAKIRSYVKNNSLHTFNNTMVNDIVELTLIMPTLSRFKLNFNSDYRQIDGPRYFLDCMATRMY